MAAQALVFSGLKSEFAEDGLLVTDAAGDADAQKAALELCNELGATTPCVNAFDPPYPVAVAPTELTEESLKDTLAKASAQQALGPRTWVLAPITEAAQPAISLTLLDFGQPVLCAVALPNLPRNSMSGDQLLRMTVSFDGQSGALPPPAGTIMWAEQGIGAYERSVGGEHGTDVPIRVDRSQMGTRSIASGLVVGEYDMSAVTRIEAYEQPRASALAEQLGMKPPPLQAEGPFAYGPLARGEVQTYLNLPEDPAAFDRSLGAHAAGVLLVQEAGGEVTDTAGNPLDFSLCGATQRLPETVTGVVATNKDVHAIVLRQLGVKAMEAAMA